MGNGWKSSYGWNQEISMIDGAKYENEGVNKNINRAKCQVVNYFVVKSSQI